MSHKKHLIALAALLLARAAFAETVNYNVFVKLDNTAESRVNDISQALAKQGVNSLFAQGYQVHLTLYLTEYDSKRLPEIQKIVSQFARRQSKFTISFTGMHSTAGKWLMLDNQPSPELQQLADEITVQLVKLRDKNAKLPDWVSAYPEKVKTFERYGSPNVFAQFNPHVTLLTPKEFNDGVAKFEAGYAFRPFSAQAVGIGIAQVDALGQAKNVLYFKPFK